MAEESKVPVSSSAGMETVTVKIDGKDVQVPKGTNILEACLQNGVDVSYFCYHSGLSSPAVCRQCLVEVKGQPKLVPSCYTPVADKMEVIASSERVQKARQQMLEFTLVNHPVDCPICDKAGECTLQKLYMDFDGKESRTEFDKVHKPKAVDLGPTIMLDAERCILCTRCIRVCDEVAGQHQLEMTFRGDHEILSVAPGEKLDNPYSLNTVDVCPVGALTSKDFRFTMRAWELYTTPSICPGCSKGCNIEIHHHQGTAWRLVPRENQAVNQFWMCDEGRFTYKEIKQNRLASSRVGAGKGLPAQLFQAGKAVQFTAKQIADAIEQGGTIGIVFGAQVQNEALYALAQFAQFLKNKHVNIRCYISGRAPRPERADSILRRADVNPNTAGATFFAGTEHFEFEVLQQDIAAQKLQVVWFVGEDIPIEGDALKTFLSLLSQTKLVITQAVHYTELVKYSHVMLPASIWAETDGTFTNEQGFIQRTKKSVEPAGDSKSHVEWILLLWQQIVQKKGWLKEQGLFEKSGPGIGKQVFHQMLVDYQNQLQQNPNVIQSKLVQSLLTTTWGIDLPPVQLRFAHSRG